jgi:hypothetical protein
LEDVGEFDVCCLGKAEFLNVFVGCVKARGTSGWEAIGGRYEKGRFSFLILSPEIRIGRKKLLHLRNKNRKNLKTTRIKNGVQILLLGHLSHIQRASDIPPPTQVKKPRKPLWNQSGQHEQP